MACNSKGIVSVNTSTDDVNLNATIEQGGEKKISTIDMTTKELLHQILMELKILNIHQSAITDMCITDKELS